MFKTWVVTFQDKYMAFFSFCVNFLEQSLNEPLLKSHVYEFCKTSLVQKNQDLFKSPLKKHSLIQWGWYKKKLFAFWKVLRLLTTPQFWNNVWEITSACFCGLCDWRVYCHFVQFYGPRPDHSLVWSLCWEVWKIFKVYIREAFKKYLADFVR